MNLLNLLTDQIPHTSSMKEFIIHLNINVIILLTLESFIPISKGLFLRPTFIYFYNVYEIL